MTDKPAAFSAVYSDWKLIKTRACVQIVLEVPLEASGQAYDALGGMPNAGKEIWCAVARLKPEQLDAPQVANNKAHQKASRQFHELKPVEQAGILCNEESFWRFLSDWALEGPVRDAEHAAGIVRLHCGVKSRKDLTADSKEWRALVSDYRAWMHEPELAGSKCG